MSPEQEHVTKFQHNIAQFIEEGFTMTVDRKYREIVALAEFQRLHRLAHKRESRITSTS